MLGPYVRITGHISIIPIWYRTAAALLCALENYGIGLLCALFFVGMAVRQRMTSLWPKVGCFVTAIAGAYTTTSVNFPKFDGDRSGEISLQVLTSLPLDHVVGRFLPTLLVATAAYYLLKDRSKRSTV